MSADNGIYILESEGPEWRVREAQAIENINWNPTAESYSDPDYFNMEYVKAYFGNCKVFTIQTEAWAEAFRLEKEILESDFPVLEYGVSSIKMPFPFPKD